MVKISNSWSPLLRDESDKEYFQKLSEFLKNEYKIKKILPEPKNIFKAFELCPIENLKVVILGQDPYHTNGVADGLAFSTKENNAIPPSLRNIFKEIAAEYGVSPRTNPNLDYLSKQGVLLLNTSLTVEEGKANSHSSIGWQIFTDEVIKIIAREKENIVYILWGANARAKKSLINNTSNLILESAHPSPLSAHNGFFGNNHFKMCNEYLERNGKVGIEW